MKNLAELRELSVEQLQDELLLVRREQFDIRLKKANQSLDKIHLIPRVRRNIARIKTIIAEKAGEIL